MKTIFQKELRENFKIALIGLAIYTFLLVEGYRTCSRGFTSLAMGEGYFWQPQNLQPLLSNQVLSFSAIFCALFGAILGWVQIHHERHRDLWAFLMHRPISRTEIFFGKAAAGLCLYGLGAGLPLAVFVVMVAMPGHFAVPFQWKMVFPLAAYFLSGLVYYFGGLLISVRQARWYASRGLGLGAGIVISLVITTMPDFWRVWIFLVPAFLIVGLAAWGSFVGNGYYEGQPKRGRRALVTALLLGCCVVISFVTMLLMSLRSQMFYSEWTNYQMASDGTIYKIISRAPGKPAIITDLKGAPVMDKKTGRPILQKDLYKIMAQSASLGLDFGTNSPENFNNRGFGDSSYYFSLWRRTEDTLWYWCPNGRLWGYDIPSRRFIGSLGPNGFAAGVSTVPDRFSRTEGPRYGGGYYDENYPAKTLMTDTAVYKLDYDNRTSRPFFTTTNNERIGAATDVSFGFGNWDYTLVATKDLVRVMTPDGKCYSQISLEPYYPLYSGVAIYFLSTNEVAFWLTASYATNELRHWKVPQHIVWVAEDQSVIKTLDLPSQQPPQWKEPFVERLPDLVMPPAGYVIYPFANRGEVSIAFKRLKFQGENILLSVAGAIVYAVIGLVLGRRYHFSIKDQMKWTVWHLFFSLPGLLAFLCVQEWPAHEACPNCKKLRLVNRKKCEYCEAEFAPPAKVGIEIFETAKD